MIPAVEIVLASNILNQQNQSNLLNMYQQYLKEQAAANTYFEEELLPSFEQLFQESLQKEREKTLC